VDKALELGPDWLTFDCRLVRTQAGLAAAAGGRWEDAERHFAVAEQDAQHMSNLLELADLRRLRARMLLDRAGPAIAPEPQHYWRTRWPTTAGSGRPATPRKPSG
jgi:hypothetical protein